MKYGEEIARDVQLDEQDFLDLFRNQEATDENVRVHIKKLDFLRALGRLDPMHQLTPEEQENLQEQHGSPHSPSVIEVEEMEDEN